MLQSRKLAILSTVVAAAMVLAVSVSLSQNDASSNITTCNGVQVAPGATAIQDAINAHGTGTNFCLGGGTYLPTSTINPKDGDSFTGTADSRDGTTVKAASGLQIIFSTDGTNGVTFRHFAITGAVNSCPGSNCGPTGSGINRGGNVTIDDMHLYGNGRNGVGGTSDGLVVENSEVDHNGAKTGDGVSSGIKSVHVEQVSNNFIHDNINNGVWCDIQCGSYIVDHNTITGNTGNGIFMEISQGPAVIHDNLVTGNNTSGSSGKGGISITSSKNATVYNNTTGTNRGFGIAARADNRAGNCGTPNAGCGYALANILFYANTTPDGIQGCSISGVKCTPGPAPTPTPSSSVTAMPTPTSTTTPPVPSTLNCVLVTETPLVFTCTVAP